MFWTRLISGIVLVIALIVLFVVGNPWLLGAIGLLSLLGRYELMRVFGIEKEPSGIVNYVTVVLVFVAGFCSCLGDISLFNLLYMYLGIPNSRLMRSQRLYFHFSM